MNYLTLILVGVLLVPVVYAQDTEYEALKLSLAELKPSSKTISILHPKGSLANLKPIIDTFTQLTGVKVHPIEGSLDQISAELILNQKLKINNKQVDIALPATFSIPDLVTNGVIASLDKLESKYSSVLPKNASLYERGDYFDGKRYGFQTDGDTYLLFINKEFLENKEYQAQYKERYSTVLVPPTTWSELDRQIKFFHRPDENKYGGLLFRNKSYIGWEFLVRLHAHGITPFDKNFKPQVATKTGVKVLEEMRSLNNSLYPGIHKIGLFKNFDLFKQGNVYANIGWGGTQKSLMGEDSAVKNKLIYSLLPGEKDGLENSAYFNWGWSYVVTTQSQVKELAYLFIRFATSNQMSTLAVSEASGFFDPFKESHYNSTEIQRLYSPEFLRIHRKSLEQSIPDFNVAARGEYMNILNQAIYSSSMGQVAPKLALKEVERVWARITNSVGAQTQKRRWQEILKSYPQSFLKIKKR